jgi:putative hydrolase of HD superfamily
MLARMTPGVDENKALRLALFHDLPEARTGDHNYVAKRYVTVDETAAAHDAAQNAPNGPEIEALVIEFNEGQSEEARIAYDADQLDMMVELKEKKDLGNPYAGAWLHYARKRLRTTGGLALADAVMATDWTHWWFRREDHLWVLNHDE